MQDYLGLTRKHYQAELESVDFKSKSEEARVNINSWVEKQTQGGSMTSQRHHFSIILRIRTEKLNIQVESDALLIILDL